MYKRYERYKDSGVEWIGEIPEHWDINKLKRLAKIVTGNTPPKRDDKNYSVEGIQWIKPDNILDNGKVAISKERLSEVGLSKARLIPAGSALVCCIGTIGRVGVNDKDVTTNQQINSVIFNRNDLWHNGYGYYSLLVSQKEHNKYSNKVVVPILNKDNQGNIYFPVPNKYEQTEISDFLNRKTSEIDSLIADKEELIKKLEEYKQSIITEAVTKGLNPDVKMKDSGIEWIGEIPEHWEIKRLKDFSNITRGTVDKAIKEDEIPVYLVQYTNVYYKREQRNNDEDYLLITVNENELKNSKIGKGDILVTASSETPDDIGRSTVIYDELNNHVFGSDVLRVRIPEEKMALNYKKYLIENYIYLQMLNSLCRGVTRFRFSMNDFKTIRYLIPPLHEQEKIADYLDDKVSDIESLKSDINAHINNLKSYRQSLIYEAVTGKIDVRDYQPERSEQLA
jgi:type I restriction enzyme, S subunit